MIFFKMAILNMLKHWKRTILIIFSVFISVFVMELVAGMFEGIKSNFFNTVINRDGNLVINKNGWKDRLDPYSLDFVMYDSEQAVKTLKLDDRVEFIEEIIPFGGMLIRDDKNITIGIYGVDKTTAYFEDVTSGIIKGEFLPENEGIAISARVSDLLNLDIHERISLLVEDSEGSPWYEEFEVTGIFQSDSLQFDENWLFISKANAQNLLYINDGIMELRVALTDPEYSEPVKNDFINNPGNENFEIQTWQERNGSLLVMIEFLDVFIVIMDLMVVIIAATVITNSILMNVFERTKEFGTMRAIGLKRKQVFGMIITEGIVNGVAGSILGLTVGIPVVLYIQVNGLDWGAAMEAFGMGSLFNFTHSISNSVTSFTAGVFIALAGSLYAARVSIKMNLIETLNYV